MIWWQYRECTERVISLRMSTSSVFHLCYRQGRKAWWQLRKQAVHPPHKSRTSPLCKFPSKLMLRFTYELYMSFWTLKFHVAFLSLFHGGLGLILRPSQPWEPDKCTPSQLLLPLLMSKRLRLAAFLVLGLCLSGLCFRAGTRDLEMPQKWGEYCVQVLFCITNCRFVNMCF